MTNQIAFARHQVVVVGGGPAGSTAAFVAASAGLDVCLIDKSVFPRDKLCGGLITARSKNLYQEIYKAELGPDIINSSENIAFLSDHEPLAEVHGYSTLYFTMRRSFDAHLIDRAAKSGVKLRMGQGVRHIDAASNSLKLSDGSRVEYQYLIGADGVNSLVAQELFGRSFDPNTIGFGLEVEVPRARLPSQSDCVEIDFGAARWGYGWVFPKPATFTIGVGGIHRLNPDMKQLLERYLQGKGLTSSDFKVKGQYIPFGDFRLQPGMGNILLCGDAAGLVDPITGEGIAYAMESGSLAAKAIVRAEGSADGTSAFAEYKASYRRITGEIRQANAWRQLIFPKLARPLFKLLFRDAGTLQRGYLDILAGVHGYRKLPILFGIQAAKAIRKFTYKLVGRKPS